MILFIVKHQLSKDFGGNPCMYNSLFPINRYLSSSTYVKEYRNSALTHIWFDFKL